jgi:hypothetical protein
LVELLLTISALKRAGAVKVKFKKIKKIKKIKILCFQKKKKFLSIKIIFPKFRKKKY